MSNWFSTDERKSEDRKYWIAVPVHHDYTPFQRKQRKAHTYASRVPLTEYKYEWHKLPEGIYEYGKEYPVCKCGRKYIKKCYHCQYGGTERTG